MSPGLVILIIALMVWAYIDTQCEQRRINRLLEAVDRDWNECLNTHREEIMEAYRQGKTVEVRMNRR